MKINNENPKASLSNINTTETNILNNKTKDTNKKLLAPKTSVHENFCKKKSNEGPITVKKITKIEASQQNCSNPTSANDNTRLDSGIFDKVAKVSSTNVNSNQLLHPDWRRVPWRNYFGWTDSHQKLWKTLRFQTQKGSLNSIYYKSPEEHLAAGQTWRYHHRDGVFLGGPCVHSATEMLEIIHRVYGVVPKGHRGVCSASDYEADDEE